MGRPKRKTSIRRVCIALFCGVPMTVVIWLAATRWNGVPASMSHPVEREPRNPAFANALAALPTLPPITLPPPPSGMKWTGNAAKIELSEVLVGPWTPESRPNLQSTIAFLESSTVSVALDALVGLPLGDYDGQSVTGTNFRIAVRLLMARARYRLEEKNDLSGAFDDLIGLVRMSHNVLRLESDILVLSGWASEADALHEMARLALEKPPTRKLARTYIQRIEADSREIQSLFNVYTNALVSKLMVGLDATYTKDQNGNGWLVLSRQPVLSSGSPPLSVPRFGAWNVISPLFNDRRTVLSKIEWVQREMLDADRSSFRDGQARLLDLASNSPINILDGPAWIDSLTQYAPQMFVRSRGLLGRRAITITSVAIAAYETETGRIPDSLADLVPDFMPDIANDPFDGLPLRYRVEPGGNGYLLYSVGSNLIDDGGVKRSQTVPEDKADQIFDFRRTQDLLWEPKLEKIR